MSSMTNESGGRKMTKGRKVSPSVDESCKDGSLGGGVALKKGPWTATEDAILMDYVNKHGEGNWNAVQKHSGLSRCGKSCRLRWANHLRPDLKKGAFTPEEEDRIIKLHSQMGNKWARMAAELPGRTDNEIKNFWNTRFKRLQRAGLPIYPPGMCLQVSDGNQEGPNMGTPEAGDTHCSDLLEGESFEIPEVEFKNLELDRGIYSYMPPLLVDIPASSVLRPSVSSSPNFSYMLPTVLPPKRPRESESLYPCVDGSAYPFESSSPFDPDFIYHHQFPFGGVHGSHVFINGNSSSSSELLSEAIMKSELPSLQYSETQQGSWDSLASPLPSLESVDTLIQSPPTKHSTGAECFSPRSTGLLEAVLYQSQALKRPKTFLSQQTSDEAAMASDAVDSFSAEVKEWEIYGDHPNSHLGYAVASEFSEYAPISQSSSGESQIEEIITGCDVKPEEVSAQNAEKNELPMTDFSRPDALLDWSCFGDGSKRSKECILSDAIGALLGEDYISDDN